ncbi:hypothetical protein NKJ40_29575 [Mesorhizobium sp. M0119]|uniref:hypothetical protein n=1 Tax=Mesorhizobium sp. M0119 TaxID=2956885 RepID=UPI003336646D
MNGITRRSLLALTGAAAVIDPASADGRVSPKLQALIETHETAYVALHRVVHRAGSSSRDRKRADRIEEEALLAVCSYPAISRGDRWAKAEYLLTVEARGELDVEEHMQAILYSMM